MSLRKSVIPVRDKEHYHRVQSYLVAVGHRWRNSGAYRYYSGRGERIVHYGGWRDKVL